MYDNTIHTNKKSRLNKDDNGQCRGKIFKNVRTNNEGIPDHNPSKHQGRSRYQGVSFSILQDFIYSRLFYCFIINICMNIKISVCSLQDLVWSSSGFTKL